MANRTAYQVQLAVVKPGDYRIHSDVVRGTADDEWDAGYVLTMTIGGRAATLPATIDSTISGPVKYIALDSYDGEDATEYVNVFEIASDTVCVAQISTGSATTADIGKQGTLVQDATTGNYAVDVTSSTDASIEIVDVEPNYQPFGTYADGNYNLVWFKFLSDVLDIDPAAASSS